MPLGMENSINRVVVSYREAFFHLRDFNFKFKIFPCRIALSLHFLGYQTWLRSYSQSWLVAKLFLIRKRITLQEDQQ